MTPGVLNTQAVSKVAVERDNTFILVAMKSLTPTSLLPSCPDASKCGNKSLDFCLIVAERLAKYQEGLRIKITSLIHAYFVSRPRSTLIA